jgi:hypothetical protein
MMSQSMQSAQTERQRWSNRSIAGAPGELLIVFLRLSRYQSDPGIPV